MRHRAVSRSRMWVGTILCGVGLPVFPHGAAAQAPTSTTRTLGPAWCNAAVSGPELVSRTSVGASITARSKVFDAASVSYQRPDSGPAFGTVRTAISVDVCRGSKVSLGPFVEYQWTSMPGARTNSLAAGMSADWQLRQIGAREASSSPILELDVLHRSDRERQREAVQLLAKGTLVMNNRRWPAPNAMWSIKRLARVTWAPMVGTAIDRAITGPNALRGTTVRLLASADASVMSATKAVPLRLSASFGRQIDVSEPVDDDIDVHDLLRVNLDVDLVRTNQLAAGMRITREQGRDPLRAIPDRRFWLISLAFSKPRPR